MTVGLKEVVERTGSRTSVVPEYLEGRAPEAQRQGRHGVAREYSYYGLPAIRRPAWKWYIPAYFFAGGVASGAYIIALLADIRNRAEELPLVRGGYLVSLAMAAVGPLLLIADLGRPRRWYNMFRVFRPRSMMNLGTWTLTLTGLFSGAGIVSQLLRTLGPRHVLYRTAMRPLRALSWLGILPAGFQGAYTGVLLSATAIPLWARNRLLMAPLFLSSALSTGLAGSYLAAPLFGTVPPESEARIRRAERNLKAVELALTIASGVVLRDAAAPLLTGRLARSYQVGAVGLGILGSLALSGVPALSRLTSLLTLAGGAVMRYGITEAGLRQAMDPRAYFRYTGGGRER